MKLINAARFYASHGLSIIPCLDKRPTVKSWKEFQSRIMTDDEIITHFADKNDDTDQIAIIAGIVFGGLEIIDFDIKHLDPDTRSAFWDDFNKNLLHCVAGEIIIIYHRYRFSKYYTVAEFK